MKRIVELIKPKKIDKILIIGTGVYPLIEEILYKDFGVKSIISGDINKENIENAKKILPQLDFIYLDAQKRFLFKEKIFDKIILTEVLEHLKNEKIVLEEIKRVLKKEGSLILSIPKRRWYKIFSPITLIQHKREYTEKKIIKNLEKNGFVIEELFVGGDVYDLFNLWLHLIWKYFFGILHIDPFFKRKIEKSYSKEFKGKGTDILIRAGRRK